MKPKILIVEDDPVSQSILSDLVGLSGYEVILADTGEEGWDILSNDPSVSFTFIDWQLPGMDGLTLCSRIKAEITDRYVYAIMITAKSGKDDLIKGMRSGADDFLSKPVHEGELLSRLRAGERVLSYDGRLRDQMSRADDLLTNILPPQIAHRLKSGEHSIADYLPEASILFMDIVGFTTWCHETEPRVMIEQLSALFALFDEEIKAHGVEKVKSIGDAYLVASGLPHSRPDFAQALVACALSINKRLARLNEHRLHPWVLRTGIASGAVIAGVIGHHRFIYDVWGDTVNHASRLERLAQPGDILLCGTTRALIRNVYDCEDCGRLDLRGIGKQPVWRLLPPETPSTLSHRILPSTPVTTTLRPETIQTAAHIARDSISGWTQKAANELAAALKPTAQPCPTAPTLEQLQLDLPSYQLTGLLGQGGMGAVYKATQRSLNRTVAIKVLPSSLAEYGLVNFVERFRAEAIVMAKLNHSSIVAVHDFGQTASGMLYFAMEYVDGTDVAKLMQRDGKLHPQHAVAIAMRVCEALTYAHARGVLHRDIKPANVIVAADGSVKVADFGLAKVTDDSLTAITTGSIALGTHDFVAPERYIQGVAVDHRADLYSLGVMLYQMLTGQIPRGRFRLPSELVGVDPRFDHIIIKTMEPERDHRYASATELREVLHGVTTSSMAQAADTAASQTIETSMLLLQNLVRQAA